MYFEVITFILAVLNLNLRPLLWIYFSYICTPIMWLPLIINEKISSMTNHRSIRLNNFNHNSQWCDMSWLHSKTLYIHRMTTFFSKSHVFLFLKEERNRGEVTLGLTFEKYSPTNHPFIQKIENLRFFFKNFRCKLLLLQWLHNKSILWLKTQKFLVNKTCDQNIHLWFWINLYTPISYTMLRVQHWIFFWQ